MDIQEITDIEDGYRDGGPVLGEALIYLRARWEAGQRDRETCLRLLFLAWYTLAEPPCFTGLPDEEDMRPVLQSVFAHLNEAVHRDPEFLLVAGYMATLFPWACGEESQWENIGRDCLKEFREAGEDLAPDIFSGRGAYGDYFAHIISSGWIEECLEAIIRGE